MIVPGIRIGFRVQFPGCYKDIHGYVFRGTGVFREDGDEFTDEDLLFLKLQGIGEEFKNPIYRLA